jgi:hypothetical protein
MADRLSHSRAPEAAGPAGLASAPKASPTVALSRLLSAAGNQGVQRLAGPAHHGDVLSPRPDPSNQTDQRIACGLKAAVERRNAGAGRKGLLQRQPPKAPPETEEKKAKDERAELQAALAEYDENWTEIVEVAAEFPDLVGWLSAGDTVLALIHTHTEAGLAAIGRDRELFAAAKAALESDVEMYEFISWHIVGYVNLLALEADIEDLAEAFEHDDRPFTGRDEAERLVEMLDDQIAKVPESAASELELFRGDIELVVRKGRADQVTLTVTSAHIAQVLPTLRKRTIAMMNVQINVQRGVGVLNKFVATARREGFKQAVDSVAEFLTIRGKKGRTRGPRFKRGAGKRRQSRKRKKKKGDSGAAADRIRKEIRQLLRTPWLRVGPFAKGSVPTTNRYIKDVTAAERRQVSALGNLHGDHHTGVKAPGVGDWIPDHQPVTRLVEQASRNAELKAMMAGLRMPTTLAGQKLYPHSLASALAQGGTVRAIQLKLVTLAAAKKKRR